MSNPSHLETAFLTLYRQTTNENVADWIPEYQFNSGRKWRFDFVWHELDLKVAVELEGTGGEKSRHTTRKGYASDCAKYNNAQIAGWIVIRLTGDMLLDNPVDSIGTVLLAIESRRTK